MGNFEREFIVDESGVAEEKLSTKEGRKKPSSHPEKNFERKFIVDEFGVAEEKPTMRGLEKQLKEQIKNSKNKAK